MDHSTDEAALLTKLTSMAEELSRSHHLLRLGRLFSETVLLEVSGAEFYLGFDKGVLICLTQGPSRKTPWRFAMRVDGEALARFWRAAPAPGFHDVFALVKIGRARIDGDILVLVKNLRFFKEFMALGRGGER